MFVLVGVVVSLVVSFVRAVGRAFVVVVCSFVVRRVVVVVRGTRRTPGR